MAFGALLFVGKYHQSFVSNVITFLNANYFFIGGIFFFVAFLQLPFLLLRAR